MVKKKVRELTVDKRRKMLGCDKELSIRQQSDLLGISNSRSGYYYIPIIDNDTEYANLIKDIYLNSDCRYGYRKITESLNQQSYKINHKKVLRIMQDIGIEGLYPRKKVNTSRNNPLHSIYPYLLNDIEISYPNHVWSIDITYIRLRERFVYFVAIIDIYSRYIVSHDLSGTLEADFCIYTLKQALLKSVPVIFNSDQGCQFTSNSFINVLLSNDIKISMDHKGRCFDNIHIERLWRTLKQESIYYYRPESILELEKCIEEFVYWYNNERLHQGLKYKTPKQVYNEELHMKLV